MANLIQSLYIGASALAAQQKALQITSHNISNVNTEGYSRQRVNFEALTWQTRPCMLQEGIAGVGVRATGVERIYDQFLGARINAEASEVGQWEAQKGPLDRVEGLFNESLGGLTKALCEFWDAWEDLSNNPDGQTERAILLVRSQNLTDTFNRLAGGLDKITKDIETSLDLTVAEINSLSAEIAALNKNIVVTEAMGQSANDFRDRRDMVLKELANLVGFDAVESDKGNMVIKVADVVLVDGFDAKEMTMTIDAVTDLVEVSIQVLPLPDPPEVLVNNVISGGRLKGWIDMRDDILPGYVDTFNALATALITEVNDIHLTGYGLDDLEFRTFFEPANATNPAALMAINNDLKINSNRIAAAQNTGGTPLSGLPGDPANAIAIAQLRNKNVGVLGGRPFEKFYNDFISGIGVEGRGVERKIANHKAVADQLANYRESVSGVHLDEEMTNLIKYQYAYTAAAKLIGTIDEMMQTVLSLK